MPKTDSALAFVTDYAASLPAERNATVVWFRTDLDNYSPIARDTAYGYAVRYVTPDGYTPGIVLWASDFGKIGSKRFEGLRNCTLLIDDGATVTPYYVAGWQGTGDAVFFQPYPTNPDGRVRPDNGQPIDFSGWTVGPRRAYHVKVSPVTESGNA